MSQILRTHEISLEDAMREMGQRARAASARLASMTSEQRTRGLNAMADALETAETLILDANKRDMAAAKSKGLTDAMLDRLALDPDRLHGIANAVRDVARLPDPVGTEIARWTVPSGLDIARVRTPLGVIGIIYEARPNVTADAAALCLRSGNAAILRAGSESLQSALAIATALRSGLEGAGLPADAIQLVNTPNRDAVGYMLAGLEGNIDVIVPRGGKGLVARVQADARVPVIGHLEGLCHAYVDADADADKAVNIVLNAKMRRTGICGALETLLVNRSVAETLLPAIAAPLRDAGCELRGDKAACEILPDIAAATEEDWQTEYLAPILSVKIVDDLDAALDHIAHYGTGHTELIITENASTAERFLADVDAGIVLHNASTQFADGGQFGMGAEIGIATGRIHARGPVGAEQLTIFKYVVRGHGETRP
ncbi:glutamate-5-semialdehyde dehydrogenase [Henriciella aquimarina]|uniref:glutamate-5-semialdehyde dehydrogenase n=1 Tax=Henriciella aquimarina TaxID=545261 RepID=UPI000A026AC7|nr:glutamate-5-semialdehyde dehydrogenase [Henriciella aquimarina]